MFYVDICAHIKNNTLAGRHNVDIQWKEREDTQKRFRV